MKPDDHAGWRPDHARPGEPSRSMAQLLTTEDGSEAHFGWIGRFFGMDVTASSARTRELLGWTPTGPTLFEDIAAGAYALPE